MTWKSLKIKFFVGTILGIILVTSLAVSTVHSQIPNPLNNITQPSPQLPKPDPNKTVVSRCILLEGRCLFKIAGQKSELSSRVQEIEQRLQDLNQTYSNIDNEELKINQEPVGNLRDIYASLGYKEFRLMTVTSLDADLEKVNIAKRTDQIIEQLKEGLKRAKQEQQKSFLLRQAAIALGTAAAMMIANLIIAYWKKQLKHSKAQVKSSQFLENKAVETELNRQQKWHFKEVQHLLAQITQGGVWIGGTLFILGLFPQTRAIQTLVIYGMRIPIRVGVIGLITYISIRLSYVLIARFTKAITHHYSLVYQESNRRLRLRVNTISGITKSIVTIICLSIGILITLSVVGLDIAPILAGAGIIGLAISFASQNLIKDTLNGFFIILEDQYAVGDVIAIGNFSGLVENLNLRITQLRDSEGRLITIPNSEIRAVANLSSQWSRADLTIPVPYQTNIITALELITQVAQKMNGEPHWRENILEPPEVLGVENFDERGVIIRVWIKTKPLKQWDVSREFRRRLKIAFDEAGVPIPPPQQQVWFDNSFSANGQRNRHN